MDDYDKSQRLTPKNSGMTRRGFFLTSASCLVATTLPKPSFASLGDNCDTVAAILKQATADRLDPHTWAVKHGRREMDILNKEVKRQIDELKKLENRRDGLYHAVLADGYSTIVASAMAIVTVGTLVGAVTLSAPVMATVTAVGVVAGGVGTAFQMKTNGPQEQGIMGAAKVFSSQQNTGALLEAGEKGAAAGYFSKSIGVGSKFLGGLLDVVGAMSSAHELGQTWDKHSDTSEHVKNLRQELERFQESIKKNRSTAALAEMRNVIAEAAIQDLKNLDWSSCEIDGEMVDNPFRPAPFPTINLDPNAGKPSYRPEKTKRVQLRNTGG